MYAWNFEPTLILGLALQPIAYLLLIGPLRRFFPGASPMPQTRVQIFLLGSLTIFIALVSPIDTLAGASLSMHMVQHLLLALVAAPLLVAGTPPWLFRPLLRLPLVLPVARVLTRPLPSFVIFNAVFLLWHVPAAYEAALQNRSIHILEHITMLSAAVLTWWPVFSTMEELPPASPLTQSLYLFFQSIPPTILGALITFSGAILYPTYARAPRVLGLTPELDQQLGGLIMWVPGGLIFFAVLTVVFIRYMDRDEYEPDQEVQPLAR